MAIERDTANLKTLSASMALVFVLGLIVGGLAVYTVTRDPDLPRQETVVGRVTAVNSDRTGFGFATDDGRKTGFGVFETEGQSAIDVGARLRLVVVDGDGYQVVVRLLQSSSAVAVADPHQHLYCQRAGGTLRAPGAGEAALATGTYIRPAVKGPHSRRVG